jgi:hypothetical protein
MIDLNEFKTKHAAILQERDQIIARLNELDKAIAEMKALNPAPKRGRKPRHPQVIAIEKAAQALVDSGAADQLFKAASFDTLQQADSGEQTQINEINSL